MLTKSLQMSEWKQECMSRLNRRGIALGGILCFLCFGLSAHFPWLPWGLNLVCYNGCLRREIWYVAFLCQKEAIPCQLDFQIIFTKHSSHLPAQHCGPAPVISVAPMVAHYTAPGLSNQELPLPGIIFVYYGSYGSQVNSSQGVLAWPTHSKILLLPQITN